MYTWDDVSHMHTLLSATCLAFYWKYHCRFPGVGRRKPWWARPFRAALHVGGENTFFCSGKRKLVGGENKVVFYSG